jgi:hypothetical protein
MAGAWSVDVLFLTVHASEFRGLATHRAYGGAISFRAAEDRQRTTMNLIGSAASGNVSARMLQRVEIAEPAASR